MKIMLGRSRIFAVAKDDIIAARLDLIAAKARILAEQYKNNQHWEGDLSRGLDEIEREIAAVRNGRNDGWAYSRGGWSPDDR
jgi:hypothetical protein